MNACCFRGHCGTCVAEGRVDASILLSHGIRMLVPNGDEQQLVGAIGRAVLAAA
jgi:hypothetical protein